jgi:lipocalin-like protein
MKRALVGLYIMMFCALPGLTAESEQLVGLWKLQTYDLEFQDTGEHTAPFGAHPNGFGVFTPEGRTIAILTAEGRKAPQTDANRAEAFRSMVAYSGMYRLEEDRWITKVDIAWNESWFGTEQVRFYRLDGDTLTVTTPWLSSLNYEGRKVRGTLTWTKVR